MNIEYTVKKPERIELFNFKDYECQNKFFEMTNKSTNLTECFLTDGNFDEQATKWFKTLTIC